jgi:micrococcal nuclease
MKARNAFLAVSIAALAYFSGSFTGLFIPEGIAVTRVIDGDTIVVEGGERVRLIGIDAPEKGQHLFSESAAYLKEMVGGRKVRLEKDVSDRDKYGRLLRYVFLGETFVNLELVKRGLASALIYEPDSKYSEQILLEEAVARERGLGIWAFPEKDFCLGIFYFRYNARGNDNQNLNDEYVTFRNKCFSPLHLKGWILLDSRNTTFDFPDIELRPKAKITLHTGRGKANETDLYWGKSRAVWNNNGDTLFLLDSDGNLVLNHSY